jgi:hypothetical protein
MHSLQTREKLLPLPHRPQRHPLHPRPNRLLRRLRNPPQTSSTCSPWPPPTTNPTSSSPRTAKTPNTPNTKKPCTCRCQNSEPIRVRWSQPRSGERMQPRARALGQCHRRPTSPKGRKKLSGNWGMPPTAGIKLVNFPTAQTSCCIPARTSAINDPPRAVVWLAGYNCLQLSSLIRHLRFKKA